LDEDHSGIITLNEVDPEAYSKLSKFQELMHAKYSSYEKAWKKLDGNGNGILEPDEFEAVCNDIGYTWGSKALFALLLKSRAEKVLSLEDVECIQPIVLANKVDENSKLVFHKCEADKLNPLERARTELLNRQEEIKATKSMDMGASDWPSLKDHLIRQFGTIFASWRYGLNKHGKGKLGFTEFSETCRSLGFTGNINDLFKVLDTDGRGVITFKEIDKDWFAKLNEFQEKLHERHGTLDKAWQVMDSANVKALDFEKFAKVCTDIGYTGDAKNIFTQLLRDPSKRVLYVEDIESAATLKKSAMGSSKGFAELGWSQSGSLSKTDKSDASEAVKRSRTTPGGL
jgi:Ca2+-binding EF-hand superfamily protein